jgi:hypothetical protein
MSDPLTTDGDFEPEQRALCPDDACIGVLDETGRCKLCGRQGTPPPAVASPAADRAEAAGEAAAAAPELTADVASPAVPPAASPDSDPDQAQDDFADRQLCVDPSCIGILDASGRCKECGRQPSDPLPA